MIVVRAHVFRTSYLRHELNQGTEKHKHKKETKYLSEQMHLNTTAQHFVK